MAAVMPDNVQPAVGIAHRAQAFAAPPPVPSAPIPIAPITPGRLPGPPARAAHMQSWAGPLRASPGTVRQPVQPITPAYLPGPPRRAHQVPHLFRPAKFVTPVAPPLPGVGEFGAAQLVLALEGARLTLTWETTILRTYSGKEQRISGQEQPTQRFEGVAFLLDDDSRDARGALMRAVAVGSAFALAVPYEELTITEDSTGSVVTVGSTAGVDWLRAGQRCIVVGGTGGYLPAIVQSTTSTTISLAVVDSAGHVNLGTLGAVGLAGARIMPIVQVLMDPQQGFARYPVNVDLWSLRATSKVFGWAGVDSMGLDAMITTYTAGEPVPVSSITDDDLLIWDRGSDIDDTSTDALSNGAQLVNLGGVPFSSPAATVPDWSRTLRYRSSDRADWQWLKAFLRLVRGRQISFLLPTQCPDLVFDSYAPGGMRVKSASTPGGGDYVSWFASVAHRRLAVTMTNGSTFYTLVTSATDNNDGTSTLTLSPPIIGSIAMISFAEQVRIDNSGSNDIAITWSGATFSLETTVIATQEVITPPRPRLFDKVLFLAYFYPPLPFPRGPQLMSGALGKITLVQVTCDQQQALTGFAADGGAQDGAVICVVPMNNNDNGINCLHEDNTAPPTARFRCANLTNIGGTGVVAWFRYNATVQRWIEIMSTEG